MKKLRPALIGFIIGGGIGTKTSELLSQNIETSTIDFISTGMLVGGVTGAILGILLSTSIATPTEKRSIERNNHTWFKRSA